MAEIQLPLIDLSSSDRASTAKAIRQACVDYGFFYLVNHGVEEDLLGKVFDESKKFFSLPLEEKMKLTRKENRGYTHLYAEKLDPSLKNRGDLKESFYIGSLEGSTHCLNQWPSEEVLPSWRPTVESYYEKVISAGKKLISLIALALDLDENFFEKSGALRAPAPFLRLLHYPGLEVSNSQHSTDNQQCNEGALEEDTYGASAHSDYGMITLLATNGVRGLQICKEKDKKPCIWEDVHHVNGTFIVNIGDMMERWTNCLFRSTLHRVIATGQERYSVALFFDPDPDVMVECLESCCSDVSPPRFPPIRSGDYLQERFRLTYST